MSTPNNYYIPGQHPNMAGFQFPPPYIKGQHPNVAGFQFPPPYVPPQPALGMQHHPLVWALIARGARGPNY